MLDEQEVEAGELLEHALADEADHVRHRDLRAGHAHLQVVGGVSCGRRRGGDARTLSPEVDTDGQAALFAGGVDGVVEAVAEGHPGAGRHHDLDELRPVSQPLDLGHCQHGVLRRDVDRRPEPGIHLEPGFQGPVVERTAVGGRVVGVGVGGGAVGPAREDGDIDTVAVEVFPAGDVGLGRRVVLRIVPEIVPGPSPRHVGVPQTRHHGAEVLNVFDIVPRQVGEQQARLGDVVVDVTVDQADRRFHFGVDPVPAFGLGVGAFHLAHGNLPGSLRLVRL